MGYFAGANLLMEYVLSNAAVARTFTEYLCVAFGENNPNTWRVEVDGLGKGYNMLDIPAVALILLLTLCLCHRFTKINYLHFLWIFLFLNLIIMGEHQIPINAISLNDNYYFSVSLKGFSRTLVICLFQWILKVILLFYFYLFGV